MLLTGAAPDGLRRLQIDRLVKVPAPASITACLLVSGILALADPATTQVQSRAGGPNGASTRDSLYALRTAFNRVQVHHARISDLLYPPGWIRPTVFICEKLVDPYCFGPRNGGVPFGSRLNAIAVEFSASELRVAPFLRRSAVGMTEYLLRELDRAAGVIPGDRWIVGQKVFHLIEIGQFERADRTARECRSDRWWCAGLVGFTSYLLNQRERADSAFLVSLSTRPPAERCKVEDVSDLLFEDDQRKWYVGLSCSEKSRLNEVIWWLADPMYLIPGNERKLAHDFRQVYRQLFIDDQAPNPGTTWNYPALPSLLVGLGVPAYVVFGEPVIFGRQRQRDILLQYKQPTYHFIPLITAARNPLRASEDMWSLHDSNAVERFHPSFGSIVPLGNQVAWFRRGSVASVVAALDLAGTGLFKDNKNQLSTSAVVLSHGPKDTRVMRGLIDGTEAVHQIAAPAESTIMSLEALVAGVGAARSRFASGPPLMPRQRVALSDLLLLRSFQGQQPGDLQAAARLATSTQAVARDRPIGIYWEVYGLAAGDSVTYAMTVAEAGRSFAANLGRVLGVIRSAASTGVSWSEVTSSATPHMSRAIALDLGSLNPGRHLVTLVVNVPGQLPVSVTRPIDVVR